MTHHRCKDFQAMAKPSRGTACGMLKYYHDFAVYKFSLLEFETIMEKSFILSVPNHQSVRPDDSSPVGPVFDADEIHMMKDTSYFTFVSGNKTKLIGSVFDMSLNLVDEGCTIRLTNL